VKSVVLGMRSGLPDQDERVARAGDRPLDQDQLPLHIDADDSALLDGRALVAHAAGHAGALEHLARRGAAADGTGCAVRVRAVRLRAAAEVMPLNRAL